MNVEMLALCDAATDAGGKLNLLGAFDSIVAKSLPVVHPQCALAVRIRFQRIEQGKHTIRIAFVDIDGTPVVPNLDTEINIAFRGQEPSMAANMVMNLQRVEFKKGGEYSIDLAIDGKHERSIPLTVRERPVPADGTN